MAKLTDLIWKNAELLRGAYKENEYRTGDLAARTEAFSKLLADIQPLYAEAKSLVRRSTIETTQTETKAAEVEALAKQADADFTRWVQDSWGQGLDGYENLLSDGR